MANRKNEIEKLIRESYLGKGICSSCHFRKRNRSKIKEGIFPRWSVPWSIEADIVLVFKVPGRDPALNEQGWIAEKELADNFERITEVFHENMLLGWGRDFLAGIAGWLCGLKWTKGRRYTEIYSCLGHRIYITEYCKCPVDKDFGKTVKNCSEYLKKEFKTLKPKLVITAGREASRHVFKKVFGEKSFSKVFGEAFFSNLNPKKMLFEFPNGPVFMPVAHSSGRARGSWGKDGKLYREYLLERLERLERELPSLKTSILRGD